MQGIFQKENTDKALKYGIYRHLPTYEKIIRNLVSFLLKKDTRINQVYKAVIFVPNTIGAVMIALIWNFILDPNRGFINNFLRAAGLGKFAFEWIGGKYLTPYTIGVMGVWSAAGFCMLLWNSGLKQIPSDVIEAGIIDGATKTQQVRYIIIPLLKENFKVILILQFTGCLKVFETVYMLTGGGPNHYSDTMVSYMYNTTFSQQFYGYGMTIAMAEFIIAMVVTLLIMRLFKRGVEE